MTLAVTPAAVSASAAPDGCCGFCWYKFFVGTAASCANKKSMGPKALAPRCCSGGATGTGRWTKTSWENQVPREQSREGIEAIDFKRVATASFGKKNGGACRSVRKFAFAQRGGACRNAIGSRQNSTTGRKRWRGVHFNGSTFYSKPTALETAAASIAAH